jgi:hypothetical protein
MDEIYKLAGKAMTEEKKLPPVSPKTLGIRSGSKADLREAVKIGMKATFGEAALAPPPVETPPPSPNPAVARPKVSPVVESQGSPTLIYGDGNIAEAGDLIQTGNTLAEVKTIASNGIVLDFPASGMEVVQGSELLKYKRVGKRGGQA